MLIRSSPMVLAVALLSASLSPASADEVDKGYAVVVYSSFNTVVRTKVVNYDDLNIATVAGGAAFRARVAGAIDKVCGGPSIFLRDLTESEDLQAFHTRSMADAMPQMQAVIDNARRLAPLSSTITDV
jgi:UrcA family protein